MLASAKGMSPKVIGQIHARICDSEMQQLYIAAVAQLSEKDAREHQEILVIRPFEDIQQQEYGKTAKNYCWSSR